MTDDIRAVLDDFRVEVLTNIAAYDIPLDIVDEEGRTVVLVALDQEPLAALARRVANVGGYANVFVRGPRGVRRVSVLPATESFFERDADDMTAEPPSGISTVGLFLDHVANHPAGVTIPALLPRQAAVHGVQQVAKDAREVQFA